MMSTERALTRDLIRGKWFAGHYTTVDLRWLRMLSDALGMGQLWLDTTVHGPVVELINPSNDRYVVVYADGHSVTMDDVDRRVDAMRVVTELMVNDPQMWPRICAIVDR